MQTTLHQKSDKSMRATLAKLTADHDGVPFGLPTADEFDQDSLAVTFGEAPDLRLDTRRRRDVARASAIVDEIIECSNNVDELEQVKRSIEIRLGRARSHGPCESLSGIERQLRDVIEALNDARWERLSAAARMAALTCEFKAWARARRCGTRVTATRSGCRSRSRRTRVIRIAAKPPSSGDPDGEPSSAPFDSSIGGAL